MIVSAAELAFDEAKHEYRLDDHVVPSVTEILHSTGIATDFEAIASRSDRLAEAIEFRRALGTAVHKDCHAYDDADLNWSAVDARVRPYLEAWKIFRENKRLEPLTRERRVLHLPLFYCGTLDGIFLRPDATRILIDIKLGDPEDAGGQYQTAAYEGAWLLEHPEQPVDERWAVQLAPERRVPYLITNYSARPDYWRDFDTFQAIVRTFHAQKVRRPR